MAETQVKGVDATSEASPAPEVPQIEATVSEALQIEATASEAPQIAAAAGNGVESVDAEAAASVPMKVDEQTAAAIIAKSEKAEEGDKKEGVEGKKESALSKKAKRRREKKAALAIAAGSAATSAAAVTDKKKEKIDVKDEGKVETALSKKARRRQERKKAALAAATGAADVAAEKKFLETKEHSGMIFMCSAKTQEDCYKYKVFGLPASKKEIVAKVYKGMRLFLFDIDLKLLFGIYTASSKGGYNIQPKAFKSAFPSQVRFSVFKHFAPLPEEKFKVAVKANYYGKNKFNCELSAEQVKNLTKLFRDVTKASERASRVDAVQSSIGRDRKRRRLSGTSHPVADWEDHRMFPRGHGMYDREVYASPPFHQAPLPLYASPPRPAPAPLPLPLPPPTYNYERLRDVDYYRRDLPVEVRGHRVMDLELRPHDPYSLYREPALYREPLYPASVSSSYPAPPPPRYRY